MLAEKTTQLKTLDMVFLVRMFQKLKSRTKSTVELATEQATNNVNVLLTHLTDCLKNDKTFRNSSFDKVKSAIETFGAWNFNNNPDLSDASDILLDALGKIDGADDLEKIHLRLMIL